jgi:hypothetical protein
VFVERITNIEGNLLYCSQSVSFEKKMFLESGVKYHQTNKHIME